MARARIIHASQVVPGRGVLLAGIFLAGIIRATYTVLAGIDHAIYTVLAACKASTALANSSMGGPCDLTANTPLAGGAGAPGSLHPRLPLLALSHDPEYELVPTVTFMAEGQWNRAFLVELVAEHEGVENDSLEDDSSEDGSSEE